MENMKRSHKGDERSMYNLAEILMRRTSLPVKLQYDACKFGGIIIFKRRCNILPFDHVSKGQKG